MSTKSVTADDTQAGQPKPQSDSATPQRLEWIDALRAGGAFLVVLAHVILYPSLVGKGPLWAQSLYYSVSRVAVPLFFMASGYLLLGKQETYGSFYRKRALRVFVPFLLWSFLYMAWNGDFSAGGLSFNAVGDALIRILRGPRAAHLWFFYVLISLYLITPILRLFTLNAKPRDLVYFCGLWFLLDPVLNLLRYLFKVQIGFEFLFLTGYIGYFVLGHLLGGVTVTRRFFVAAAATFLAALAVVFATVYAGRQAPTCDQFFEGYLSVTVVLMTAAAFILIRGIFMNLPPSLSKWIRVLSGASLGIYLLHVMALDVLGAAASRLVPAGGWGSSILMMPVAAIVGYAACLVIVYLLQRIPVVKYSVP